MGATDDLSVAHRYLRLGIVEVAMEAMDDCREGDSDNCCVRARVEEDCRYTLKFPLK